MGRKQNNLDQLEEIHLFMSRGHSVYEIIQMLKFNYQIKKFEQALLQGESFTDALQTLNYSADILLLIRINEENDNLIIGIEEAINLIKTKESNKHQLINQLRYPLFLLAMILAVLIFVNNLLLPQLVNLYKSFGVQIPGLIKIFLVIINVLPQLIIVLLIVMFNMILVSRLIDYEKKLKYISKIPFVGREYKFMYNTVFISYIYSLLKTNITLRAAVEILQLQEENKLLQKEATRITKSLKAGRLFNECLNSRLYTPEIRELFRLGIENDNLLRCLETMLLKNRKKQKKKKQRFLFLVQPIMYALIGLIIIIIYGLIFNISYGLIG